jgi:hypothetical protein
MSYYASIIHDKAYSLATTYFDKRFATYRKTPMLQVTPQDLPILAIHILREKRVQDGQNNQGEPKFKHELTLGFSGAVHGETPDQNKLYQLEQTMSELDELLLSDAQFIKLTEAIISMDRMAQYTKAGETTLFEIRVEMVCEFSSYWPPRVTDNFNTMQVTTEFPDKAHADAGTPQIDRTYTLDQGT